MLAAIRSLFAIFGGDSESLGHGDLIHSHRMVLHASFVGHLPVTFVTPTAFCELKHTTIAAPKPFDGSGKLEAQARPTNLHGSWIQPAHCPMLVAYGPPFNLLAGGVIRS